MHFKKPQKPVVRNHQHLAQEQLLICPNCKRKVKVVGGKKFNADNGKSHVCPTKRKTSSIKGRQLINESKPLVIKSDPLILKRKSL